MISYDIAGTINWHIGTLCKVKLQPTMWPFDIIERRKTIQQLGSYVSATARDEILNNPHNEYPRARQVFAGYNLILVRDDDVEALKETIDRILQVVFDSEGIVASMMGSLLLVQWGFPMPPELDPALRCRLNAEQVIERFGHQVKVVYGSGQVVAGSYGSKTHQTYGGLFARFSHCLEVLCRMNYGEMREINH